jgi:excisionase family DNA binding protein
MPYRTKAETKAKLRRSDDSPESPPDMSIPDAASYLGVSPYTVRVMIADGRLPAYRLGERIVRLRRSDIDAAMQRMGQPA